MYDPERTGPNLDQAGLHEAGTDAEVERILRIVRLRQGIDFRRHRSRTIRRRLAARMRAAGCTDAGSYLQLLDTDPAESERLVGYLTVKVTGFFRDAAVWARLAELMRELLDMRGAPLRLWSAGCATGEEAYGLAMLLDDVAAGTGPAVEGAHADREIQATPADRGIHATSADRGIHATSADRGIHATSADREIQATDLDVRALRLAEAGAFRAEALEAVPDALRDRHFNALPGHRWRAADHLRDRIDFRVHDLAAARISPLGLRFDLVLCRNVLIYLEPRARRHAFDLLVDSLSPGGYLCLGDAEWVDTDADARLAVAGRTHHVFRRTTAPALSTTTTMPSAALEPRLRNQS